MVSVSSTFAYRDLVKIFGLGSAHRGLICYQFVGLVLSSIDRLLPPVRSTTIYHISLFFFFFLWDKEPNFASHPGTRNPLRYWVTAKIVTVRFLGSIALLYSHEG